MTGKAPSGPTWPAVTPLLIAAVALVGLALLCLIITVPAMLMSPQGLRAFGLGEATPSGPLVFDPRSDAPDGPGLPLPTMRPPVTAVPGMAIVTGGDCNVQMNSAQFTGGDSYQTTYVSCVSLNLRSEPVYIESGSEAHNWLFDGQAGQVVRIRVGGTDGIDPRVKLIDPLGEVIEEQDDNDGRNVDFEIALNSTGVYVIRIDIFTAGTYTVLVETQ